MDEFFNNTKTIINNFKSLPNLEIELRLGKRNREMFDTNIGEEKFNKIKQALDNFKEWEEVKNINTTSYFSDNYRYDVNEDTEECSTIIKKKIKNFDQILKDQQLDVRLSIAQEIPQENIDIENMTINRVRCKKRVSYIRNNLSIDLTIVTGQPDDMDEESDISYEIELELLNLNDVSSKTKLYNIYYKVFCILKTL
jgi:hypothetical protein